MQGLVIPEHTLKKIDQVLYNFMWKRKFSGRKAFEKVKRAVVNPDDEQGGLKLITTTNPRNNSNVRLQRFYRHRSFTKTVRLYLGICSLPIASTRVKQSNLYFKNWTSVLKSVGGRMFLAHGCKGLKDFAGVCVTDAYEFFDGSEMGCKRLHTSSNEMMSVNFRVTMSFSCFHYGQSFEIAWWSPWQFTHFGSLWQSSTLCPSSLHPAQTAFPLHEIFVCPNFWHWKHLWGLGM